MMDGGFNFMWPITNGKSNPGICKDYCTLGI